MLVRLKEIIAQGENRTTEFKKAQSSYPKNAFETVCAFLNRDGGDLFFGVSDDGNFTGVDKENVNQIKKDFVTAINNPQIINPAIYLTVNEYESGNKTILHIFVPESSQVHRYKGRIFDRNEDGDLDVTNNNELISSMYMRKQKTYTENTIYPYATMEDLRQDIINQVRVMAVNNQPQHPWGMMTNEELLKSAGLHHKDIQTGNKGFTLACLLLFGKDETIQSVVPHHRTDAILRRENVDRYDDRDDIRCNLIDSYLRLMTFVAKHLNDKFYLDGDVRVEVRGRLFRELIANMLIHREYLNGFPAKLIIENDCVKTENSSKAHGFGEIDVNNFSPFPKNPTIAKVFREIGWAEELGSGIRNIRKFSKIYANSEPVFTEGDVFKTKIPLVSEKVVNKSSDKKVVNKKVVIKSSDKSEKSQTNVNKIIEYIKEHEKITNKEAREITDLSSQGIWKILNKLCEDGIVVANGGKRGRYYTLK